MYKTISLPNDTYQNLHAISIRLDKPKSQVIDKLVKEYIANMKDEEKKELQTYNTYVAKLAERVKLPKGTKIKSENLDKELAVLQDQNY